ncbi:MAG: methyltransferase [Thermomicrobiales bacterium]|nr:methyltransferase [Thermomicrobiales bacterium]
MSQRLFADAGSVSVLRSTLEQIGFDVAQEALRPDYLASPFPHFETFAGAISGLEPPLRIALQLLSLGQPAPVEVVEGALGRDFLEAALASGLLVLDDAGESVSTDGLAVASRLGLYFVVSTNPYYPGFNPELADVYLGPESLTLVNHLQRQATALAASGRALDLCTGSGIAGQSIGAIRRGLEWTAVDLSEQAVDAATFNAMLNGMQARFSVRQGDLYEPIAGQRFALIVANPPFIPVPDGVSFPLYGGGGEDGLTVVRPLFKGIAEHLTEQGRAIVYLEGIGNSRGPLVLDVLEELAALGFSVGVTLLSTMTAEQALFSMGRLLAAQKPSRLDELDRWRVSFADQQVTRYNKMIVEARPGAAGVVIRSVAG